MADDIMSHYQHIIESFSLVTQGSGIFRFVVNGQTLFSKKEVGRHAEPGEILKLFQDHIGLDIEPYPREL
ncbi:MAG: Rdx family protein [Anaerolineae bacterium]|nr:Rdx family protein [Anaerolineae bacterium]